MFKRVMIGVLGVAVAIGLFSGGYIFGVSVSEEYNFNRVRSLCLDQKIIFIEEEQEVEHLYACVYVGEKRTANKEPLNKYNEA